MTEARVADRRPAEKKRTGEKKPNFFARVWKKIKEIFSELKKVTWPTAGKTVKQTLVVLGVVIFFLAFIMAFDAGLGYLFELLTGVQAGGNLLPPGGGF